MPMRSNRGMDLGLPPGAPVAGTSNQETVPLLLPICMLGPTMIKTLLILVAGAGLTLSASAQDNEAKYLKKMESTFVSKISWTQSLADAQRQAKKKEMLIFGYFTRSYAP